MYFFIDSQAMVKVTGEHKQRIILNISTAGVRVLDEKTMVSIKEHTDGVMAVIELHCRIQVVCLMYTNYNVRAHVCNIHMDTLYTFYVAI